MTDQAIVGLALELEPSMREGGTEVQHEPDLEPSGWYGTADKLVYLQDTEWEEEGTTEQETRPIPQQETVEPDTDQTPAEWSGVVDLTGETDSEQECDDCAYVTDCN